MTDYRRDECLKCLRVRLHERSGHEARANRLEASLLEPAIRRCRVGKFPWVLPRREVRRERRLLHQRGGPIVQTGDVWPPSTLCDNPATRLECRVETPEELRVIANPMKGRRAEDGIGGGDHWQSRGIGEHELNLTPESGAQKIARDLQHVGGEIDSDRATARETLEQFLRQSACSTADVEDQFVSVEREPFEDGSAPIELRRGDLMVGVCVPFAHTQSRIPLTT